MNTVLIGIGSIVAILALVFVVAYISVLVDTCEHYKMMAARWEEAFEGMVFDTNFDKTVSSTYFAELDESQHDVMNGIDKHLY